MRVLVTGSAGFIGFHLCRRLLAEGHEVVGLDGMTDYYDPALKRARHTALMTSNHFQAHQIMLEDAPALTRLVQDTRADIVVHLAAQAGVRYSMEAPRSYVDSNMIGTFNLLEALRATPVDLNRRSAGRFRRIRCPAAGFVQGSAGWTVRH